MIQKLHICKKKSILISFWIFEYCFYFFFTQLLCNILLLRCWIFSIPSWCQTVWIQIRPVCLQSLSADTAGKELNTKQLVDTFFLKPWLKLISLGSNFSIWLKCWLQQILSQGISPGVWSLSGRLLDSIESLTRDTALCLKKARFLCPS